MLKILKFAGIAALLAAPITVHAQGVPEGIERGAAEGNAAAGPLGGIVRGAVGGVNGVLGSSTRGRATIAMGGMGTARLIVITGTIAIMTDGLRSPPSLSPSHGC